MTLDTSTLKIQIKSVGYTGIMCLYLYHAPNSSFYSNAGVSRSAAVVLGYLMSSNRLSLEDAMKILRQARPCVRPNEGFLRQLQDYQKQLGLL